MHASTTLSDEFDRLIAGLEPLVEVDDGTPDAECRIHRECIPVD